MNFYLDLLKLGFHGLAFAMLLLSYNQFQKIAAIRIDGDLSADQVRARILHVDTLLKALRWLMVLSVIFFLIGVTAQVYTSDAPQRIKLSFQPSPIPKEIGSPSLLKSGIQITNMRNDGAYEISVSNHDDLLVSINDMVSYVDGVRKELNLMRLQNRGLQSNAIGE